MKTNALSLTCFGPEPSGALFSDCRTYRYSLWRRWDEGVKMACFIGLNPSTADETDDDPTIRRCIGFAKRWSCDSLLMLNLFAFRATYPKDMKADKDPVGPDNDQVLRQATATCHPVVCAWGADGIYRDRGWQVKVLLRRANNGSVFHLGLCKNGQPRHPLYLPKTAALTKWERGTCET